MSRTINAPTPLVMAEAYWMNTHLSIARHFGQIQYNGYRYIIVDKMGRDLWECTAAANREGRDNPIEPGEPADLIWDGLQKHYKRLGRARIIELIQEGKTFAEIAATPADAPSAKSAASVSAPTEEASLFDADMESEQ